ncbi:MAG TPA: beta-glucosidase BglX [Candidatus Acidoferrum sp.]|nr:beta-glucosidase BglX [Candidatus Acidoferrum sp.]
MTPDFGERTVERSPETAVLEERSAARLVTGSYQASAVLVGVGVFMGLCLATFGQSHVPDLSQAARRADALLARMTLEEKIGQLVLLTSFGAATGPPHEQAALEANIRNGNCGSVFNALTVAEIRKLQKLAVDQTRLHVPLLFGYDVVHGYKTIFPIPLGEAASWDLRAIEHSARVAAVEASAAGLNWTFAPMVDIARDPRWGRICEGAGEDPFLGSAVARSQVRGFQGKDLTAPDTVLACVKHFAAYGAAMSGRDYNTVDVSERTLREVYLPPYAAAVQAGASSVMTAFNEYDGTPATANGFLLKRILRDELGFKGIVVTDYAAISELVAHGSAVDESEAAQQALAAGVDLDMEDGVYLHNLKQLLRDHRVTRKQIDAAAKRMLELKLTLGLLDDPYRHCDEQREARLVGAREHLEAAYRMACESFVLLKNDSQNLPLKAGARIAVIGPLADSQRDLLGSWKGDGGWVSVETVLDGIKRNDATDEVVFARGCEVASTNRASFAEAVAAARKADVVVAVMGESWDMSGENASRTSINLPGVQTDLLRELRKTGKPLVLVLLNGRPLDLEAESTLADAILEAWFPGMEGGKAVADVLFGKHNPCGKLPVTFPRRLGQVPIFYSVKNTGRPVNPARPDEPYKSTYLDCPNDPLYPFGFGLGYTTFACAGPHLEQSALGPGGKITASAAVSNTGTRDGVAVVQLYIRDLVGSVTRPVLELKGFQRVELKAGESRLVSFDISENDLAFLRKDMTWGTEPGAFRAFIGLDSRELRSATFQLSKK